eukprot:TRINITY_DN7168_c0_g1_i1.p1 TRINITY_DN7168_c0_g1~~TRINITY_DN7168_c0_g1_i1.p1  ORF type:complete len:434 (-),score=74.27 TRINITY_DN7168_c0_g1_i1:19-1320(-)
MDRPLGVLENKYVEMSIQCSLSACFFEINGNLTPPLVIPALKALSKRHPLLRSTIDRDASGRRVWRPLREGEEFFKYTYFEGIDNVHEACRKALMKESSESIKEGDCLFRISHFIGKESSGFVMTYSHVIMDGLSRIALTYDLLYYAYLKSIDQLDLDKIESLPQFSDIVDLVEKSEREMGRSMEGSGSFVIGERIASDNKQIPWEDLNVNIILQDLPLAILSKIQAKCKAVGQGDTIHTLLCSSFLLALQRSSKDKGEGKRRYSIGSAANIRGTVSPPLSVDHVGNFAIQSGGYADLDKNDNIWTASKQFKSNFAKDIEERDTFKIIAARSRKSSPSPLEALMERPLAYVLSNLGVVSGHPDQKVREMFGLKSMYSCVSNKGMEVSLFIGVHTVQGGNMNLCFCYPSPLYDHEKMGKIIEEGLRIFQEVGEE